MKSGVLFPNSVLFKLLCKTWRNMSWVHVVQLFLSLSPIYLSYCFCLLHVWFVEVGFLQERRSPPSLCIGLDQNIHYWLLCIFSFPFLMFNLLSFVLHHCWLACEFTFGCCFSFQFFVDWPVSFCFIFLFNIFVCT